MRFATREAFERSLMAFVGGPLFARHGRPTAKLTPIQASTNLFETGIVDSLGILDLLAFVEDATGAPIPLRQVDMQFFGTVERISRTFWQDEATA